MYHCVVFKLYEEMYVKCPKCSVKIIYPSVHRIRHSHREEGSLVLSEEILMGRVKEAIDGKCFLGNLININCNYETCMKHLIFSINLQGPGDIKKKKKAIASVFK